MRVTKELATYEGSNSEGRTANLANTKNHSSLIS